MIPTGLNAHAIQADPSNRFVLATNLGSDAVLAFKLDAETGQLTPNQPTGDQGRGEIRASALRVSSQRQVRLLAP